MKKIFVLTAAGLAVSISLHAFAFDSSPVGFDDAGALDAGMNDVYFETDRTVRYTPWLKSCALQTADEAAAGIKGGEGFQQISDIAISPADHKLMLFGTDTSGIWRSTDGGSSWYSVNTGVDCWGVHDICFHPTDRNIAYMLEGGPNASDATMQIENRTTFDGLYKTEDGGNTWTQVLDVLVRGALSTNRLIAFDDDKNIYLLSAEGLLRSSDGAAWEYVYDFRNDALLNNTVNYDLCISGDVIAFTNSIGGLFVSFNGGSTWQRKNINGDAYVCAYGFDIDPENSAHWLCCFGGSYRNLYESFDSGSSWTAIDVGASQNPDSDKFPIKVMFGKRAANGQRGIYMLFKRVYTPLRVSYNEGADWIEPSYSTPWSENFRPMYGNAINLDYSAEGKIFLGVGTVLISDDMGSTFTARNTPGYSGACVRDVVFSSSGRMYLSVRDQGIYKSESVYDGADIPLFVHNRDQSYGYVGEIGIDPADEQHIIYHTSGFSLRESRDGGASWTSIDNTEATSQPDLIQFHTTNSSIIYSTYYTSYNGGASWISNDKIISAVSPVNNDIVYSVSGVSLFMSEDCGRTWQAIYTADADITSIKADKSDPLTVWCGCKNGAFIKLTNGNVRAVPINNVQQSFYIRSIAQDPRDAAHIVVGGQCADRINSAYYQSYVKSYGLYETFNGGESWRLVQGLPSMRIVYELEFSPNTEELFIGGFTGGLLVYDYNRYTEYLEGNKLSDCTLYYNNYNRTVTVTGDIETDGTSGLSTVMVLPGNVSLKYAKAGDLVYLGQVRTDVNGHFEYNFRLPPSCGNGYYNVYLGGTEVAAPAKASLSVFDTMISVGSFEIGGSNNTVTTTVTVSNQTVNVKEMVLILVMYRDGEQYRLEGAAQKPFSISPGESVTRSITSELGDNVTSCRAFLWDGFDSMRPVTDFIEYTK